MNPFGDERAIEKAIHKIKNSSDFFASECIDLIRKAADWSISFAAGSDPKKKAFLEDVSQGKGREFLRDVLDAYQNSSDSSDVRGRCGYPIGGSDYLSSMERNVFGQDIPVMNSARWGNPEYDGLLKDALEAIAHQLERDLEYNERENNYITDDTEKALKAAVSELNRCGVSAWRLNWKIEKLSWFVGGDPAKIRQLQSKLNELGIGDHLLEDGVYGKKTLAAWEKYKEALSGSVPALGFIDPLQPGSTGYSQIINHGKRPGGEIAKYYDFRNFPKEYDYSVILQRNGNKKSRVFMLDRPHMEDGKPLGYHMNVEFEVPEYAKKYFYNHKQISESTYLKLKDFKNAAKYVRIAGKVLLVSGVALDAFELGYALAGEVKDADRKLEKSTVSLMASIGGRWTGSALGAKGGAMAGAAVGTAVFPVVGTAVGGTIGGLIGGIGGSFLGDELAEYVVDITYLED